MSTKVDYLDSNGIHRRVLLPNDDADANEGIPLSLPLESLFGHMPVSFQARLSSELFERGLVEPSDFFKPGAAELTRGAILSVCKHDALSIISLAKSLLE